MKKYIINSFKLPLIWIAYTFLLKYLLEWKTIRNLLENTNIRYALGCAWVFFVIWKMIVSIDKIKRNKDKDKTLKDFLHNFHNNFKKEYIKILIFIITILISIFVLFPYVFFRIYIYVFLLVLLIIYLFFWYIKIFSKNEAISPDWFLISDKSITKKEKDQLWMTEKAESFAKTVGNNWNNEWFIFWLVAPWWAWKSSFLKLVKNEFEKETKYNDKIIVFEFNPWYFESESILLEKFLDEFKVFIKENTDKYLPELETELDLLLKILDKKTNDFIWFDLSFFSNKSLEETKENINKSLKKIEKKIVIIIDDLDRISAEKLKTVFKIIDLCKWFYNTNFVLCYDLQNFNNIDESLKITKTSNKDETSVSSEEIDNFNLVRYIEKIVNVQYSIYPDFDKLKEYFRKLFIEWKLDFSEKSQEWIKAWIEKLFEVENFRIWGKHLSDIRSLKRIYNNIVVLVWDCEKRKNYIKVIFDNGKWIYFDKFIELSILSLSYNDLYADIYNETYLSKEHDWDLYLWGNTNKYSLDSIRKDLHYMYKSKEDYKEFITQLPKNKRSLLENIFPIILEAQKIEDSRDIRLWDNLKKYLNIINLNFWDFDEDINFENFIEEKLWEFYKSEAESKTLETIIPEIHDKYPERWIQDFIVKIKENIHSWENKIEKSLEFVSYVLENFYEYTEYMDLSSLRIDLLFILDRGASYDKENQDWDYSYLYDFLYGEWKYKDKWIIHKLFGENWWIIWLEIAIGLFYRFYEGRDRDFCENFFLWVFWLKDRNLPAEFYSARISRLIYRLFKEKYIDTRTNIFEKLTDEEMRMKEKKTRFTFIFIVFQLTVNIWSFDFYDDEKQSHWIKKDLNKYYFEICFSGENIKYFFEFLIKYIWWKMSLWSDSSRVDLIGKIKHFDLKEIYKVFEKEELENFFETRKKEIDSFIEENKDEIFYDFESVDLRLTLWDIVIIIERLKNNSI